jgi:hypothetical protein
MARDFWPKCLIFSRFLRGEFSCSVFSGPRDSTGVGETFWKRPFGLMVQGVNEKDIGLLKQCEFQIGGAQPPVLAPVQPLKPVRRFMGSVLVPLSGSLIPYTPAATRRASFESTQIVAHG